MRFVCSMIVGVIALMPIHAMAQPAPPSRPTAVHLVAQQLALAIAQNAELVERVGQLEDQIMTLRKRVIELTPKSEEPKPEQK